MKTPRFPNSLLLGTAAALALASNACTIYTHSAGGAHQFSTSPPVGVAYGAPHGHAAPRAPGHAPAPVAVANGTRGAAPGHVGTAPATHVRPYPARPVATPVGRTTKTPPRFANASHTVRPNPAATRPPTGIRPNVPAGRPAPPRVTARPMPPKGIKPAPTKPRPTTTPTGPTTVATKAAKRGSKDPWLVWTNPQKSGKAPTKPNRVRRHPSAMKAAPKK